MFYLRCRKPPDKLHRHKRRLHLSHSRQLVDYNEPFQANGWPLQTKMKCQYLEYHVNEYEIRERESPYHLQHQSFRLGRR